MKRIIFPEKLDFLSKINLHETDKYFKPILQDYIINANSSANQKPKEFFHCFGQIEEDSESKLFYESFYSILIFFEEINLQNKNSSNNNHNEKYFAPKALIIYSRNPFFLLHKFILEAIYQRSLSAQEFPIECIILSFFSIIKNKSLNCAKIFRFENFFENFDYLVEKETFLPILDLNIGAFFANFNFNQFILLAENFLMRSPILIYTDEVEKLFPFYFTFTNLIFPLNNTNVKHEYYQYCSSSTLFHIIKGGIACFFAVNSDLAEAEIRDFVRETQGKIVAVNLKTFKIKVYEYFEFENENENLKNFENKKLVNENNFENENKNKNENSNFEFIFEEKNTILRKIFDELIEKDIPQEIRLTYMLSHITLEIKNAAEAKKFGTNFFANALNDLEFVNLTNELRKQLFSLFIKFLTFHQPYTTFKILAGNKIEIILEEENFLKIFADEKIKNFYSFFTTTSTFSQICYRDGIHPLTVKNFIIINELIKIYSIDKQRIYFDFFRFSELQEKEVFENEEDRKKNGDKVAKVKKAVFALTQCKDVKIKFEDFHKVFLELIKKFKKEFQVVKLDKSIISSRIQADNVVYIILKYLYFDFQQYSLSKFQKDFSENFKNLSKSSKASEAQKPYLPLEPQKDKENTKAKLEKLANENLNNESIYSLNNEDYIFNRPKSLGIKDANKDKNKNNNNNIYENINEEFNPRRAYSLLDSDNLKNKFNQSLNLESESFFQKELIYKKKYECEILIMELLVFKNLIITENISLSDPEEIITVCYIILLTITIFFKFSNTDLFKNSKKTNFQKFTEIYKKYLEKITELKNYCFIHSIVFEIIKYLDLKENYEKEFLLSLQRSNIIPNLNITMNFQQRDLNCKNKNINIEKGLINNNIINNSCIIDESYFGFSKFNKNRKHEVDKYFKGYDSLEELSLICSEHDINFDSEKNIFKEILEIKNSESLICQKKGKNSQCLFLIFIKDKWFNLFHPKFLLLFLIDKVIKNYSLTFFIDKFFEEAKDEEYFYNLLFYFKNFKLDFEMIFTD